MRTTSGAHKAADAIRQKLVLRIAGALPRLLPAGEERAPTPRMAA
jgi:hypothetical protein